MSISEGPAWLLAGERNGASSVSVRDLHGLCPLISPGGLARDGESCWEPFAGDGRPSKTPPVSCCLQSIPGPEPKSFRARYWGCVGQLWAWHPMQSAVSVCVS